MGDTLLCVVCRRREPVRGHVCDPDRARSVDQLTDLPRMMSRLHRHLVPAPAVATDRVTTSRGGSPTPARLDVLSLLGPGNETVTATLHPAVRRWSTTRVVTVDVGDGETRDRQVVDWFQELVVDADGHPVLIGDDDQVGALPPAEWLDGWVRAWRGHFRHTTPTPVGAPTRAGGGWVGLVALPAAAPVVGFLAAVAAVARQHTTDTLLSVDHGHSRHPGRRTAREDPLTDEWETRFGDPTPNTATTTNVKYLLTWFDAACDQDVGIAAFVGELRALTAELTHVLGEHPDQQWLGRCPTTISAADTAPRVCAAGLWQDPHASQVRCPRCHSTWGPRQVELLHLAADIRRVWPVDRRRRYTLNEIDQLRLPRCPTCGQLAMIAWREVTATTDITRWWRPARSSCNAGCPEAERLI